MPCEIENYKYSLSLACFDPDVIPTMNIVGNVLLVMSFCLLCYELRLIKRKETQIKQPDPNAQGVDTYCLFTLQIVKYLKIRLQVSMFYLVTVFIA